MVFNQQTLKYSPAITRIDGSVQYFPRPSNYPTTMVKVLKTWGKTPCFQGDFEGGLMDKLSAVSGPYRIGATELYIAIFCDIPQNVIKFDY